MDQQNDHQKHEIHQQTVKIHQQSIEVHQQKYKIHQPHDKLHNQNDDTLSLNVTECDKMVRKQKDDTEISTPVTCEDQEEVVITEPSINDISLKYDEYPEISFETTIGSLPSEKDAFPRSKVSHAHQEAWTYKCKG